MDLFTQTRIGFFNWTKINSNLDTIDFKINQEYAKLLKEIINVYSPQVEKIYLGYDHSSILNAIEMEKHNLNPEYYFNLYNIDYHHDITYSTLQEEMIIEQGYSSCANWVGFLNYYNCLNYYYWFKGIGSSYDSRILNKNILTPSVMKQKKIGIDDFPLNLQNVKILYITYSYPWISFSQEKEIENFIQSLNIQDKIYYFEGPYSINHNRKKFLNRIEENKNAI